MSPLPRLVYTGRSRRCNDRSWTNKAGRRSSGGPGHYTYVFPDGQPKIELEDRAKCTIQRRLE
jgi:hypothetical protein